jgi:hypothetical protein
MKRCGRKLSRLIPDTLPVAGQKLVTSKVISLAEFPNFGKEIVQMRDPTG